MTVVTTTVANDDDNNQKDGPDGKRPCRHCGDLTPNTTYGYCGECVALMRGD